MTTERKPFPLATAMLELVDRQTTTEPKPVALDLSRVEEHLEAIRAHLTTREEQTFFDQSIAKIRDQRPEHLNQLAQFTVDDAVAILRAEMPQSITDLIENDAERTAREGYPK
jgi:hypothetical protein